MFYQILIVERMAPVSNFFRAFEYRKQQVDFAVRLRDLVKDVILLFPFGIVEQVRTLSGDISSP